VDSIISSRLCPCKKPPSDAYEKTASPSSLDITKGDCVWRINRFNKAVRLSRACSSSDSLTYFEYPVISEMIKKPCCVMPQFISQVNEKRPRMGWERSNNNGFGRNVNGAARPQLPSLAPPARAGVRQVQVSDTLPLAMLGYYVSTSTVFKNIKTPIIQKIYTIFATGVLY
jgi:hypothetical protein